MELPTKRSEVKNENPAFMVIFSRPKQGKSTWISAIDDNLVIDLEDGYRALSVLKVQVRNYNDFLELRKLIIEKGIADGCTKENGKKPYKFITIDNATRLEEYLSSRAADLYRATLAGSKWGYKKDAKDAPILKDGKPVKDPNANVLTLPKGQGYYWIRLAVKSVIDMFRPLCETLILVAHVKDTMINRNGEELSEMSVDLTGKLSDIIAGQADAIGYMYRKGNKTYMSFQGGDNILKEARPLHIRNKTFTVIESDDSGEICKINIDDIFPKSFDTIKREDNVQN